MNIAIVSPCSSGPLADLIPESAGVDLGCGAHFMATLVKALVARGHQVSVITLSSGVHCPVLFKGPNLTYYVYPMRTQRRMRDLYKLERQGLLEGILAAKPDVLHAHWTYEFAMACLETKLPLVVTSHDNAFQQLRFCKDLYRLGRLYIQLRVIKQTPLLTAVSPYLANSLQWLAKTEIEMIPNAVKVPEEDDRRCERFAGSLKIATILNGWSSRKNPKNALRAFHLLRRRMPDAELFMYGYDFEEGGIASEWSAHRGLNKNVHFCGFLPPPELQQSLSRMALLLHPSLEEACPLAILEAMALKVPIVAGQNAGGVPWLLDGGEGGFLTEVRDPEKIAKALLECVKEADVRRRKQELAYDKVVREFSPDGVAGQYEKVYERALASKACAEAAN
jgi:glycosyltransferase involved in cell wall biosynthesis